MSWDPVWETIFQSRDWGRYPPEELVRFIATHFHSEGNRQKIKILELGSGTGANIWYLAREGFDVFGIEGSLSGIRKTQDRLQKEGLRATLQQGDMTDLGRFYSPGVFDAIVDVSSLQHNPLGAIESILRQAHLLLKPNGRIFSKLISMETHGRQQILETTAANLHAGVPPAVGTERYCHYLTIEDVRRVFSIFRQLECNYVKYSMDHQRHVVEFWTAVGIK